MNRSVQDFYLMPDERFGFRKGGTLGFMWTHPNPIFAAVGLAQNFAAIRALGSIGIQKGHMALHARCVAVTAGARGDWVEKVANLLVKAGSVKVEKAREIIAALPREDLTEDVA